jgi:hypothetical protein
VILSRICARVASSTSRHDRSAGLGDASACHPLARCRTSSPSSGTDRLLRHVRADQACLRRAGIRHRQRAVGSSRVGCIEPARLSRSARCGGGSPSQQSDRHTHAEDRGQNDRRAVPRARGDRARRSPRSLRRRPCGATCPPGLRRRPPRFGGCNRGSGPRRGDMGSRPRHGCRRTRPNRRPSAAGSRLTSCAASWSRCGFSVSERHGAVPGCRYADRVKAADESQRASGLSEEFVRDPLAVPEAVLDARRRPMSERLELALSWNTVASELRAGLAAITRRESSSR